MRTIAAVTKKGQATIPTRLLKKHKIGRRVLLVDAEGGILLKPITDPMTEKGSLKKLFARTDSRQLIEEARRMEKRRDRI